MISDEDFAWASEEMLRQAENPTAEHRCGFDLDPWCDGCRTALRDAGEKP